MNKYGVKEIAQQATNLILTCMIAAVCLLAAYWASVLFSPPESGSAGSQSVSPAQSNFSSPSSEVGVSNKSAPAFTFEDLLDAIEWVESKGKADAVGKDGELGSFQIKKIYVDDVNRIMDATRQQYNRTNRWQFCYEDRKNKHLGRVMTGIYLKHYGGTFEKMARKHNGGPAGHKKESTKAYWQKVKARMENQ